MMNEQNNDIISQSSQNVVIIIDKILYLVV